MKKESLLEALEYDALINLINYKLIENKELYILIDKKELLNGNYKQLVFYLTIEGYLPTDDTPDLYLHKSETNLNLTGDIRIMKENIYKNITMTLKY